MSRTIRVTPDVMETLEQCRRPDDRNWSDVIRRVLRHRRAIAGGSSNTEMSEAQRFFWGANR